MKHVLKLVSATLILLLAAVSTATAKECKAETTTITSDPFRSRVLGAFPHSLIVWRRTIREKYGNGWQPWRKAEDRKIDCNQSVIAGVGKRWICKRTARACKGIGRLGGATGCTITGKVVPGDSGKQVQDLQRLLHENGADINADGKYGPATEAAVRRFQQDHNLTADGIAGPITLEALGGGRCSAGNSSGPAKPGTTAAISQKLSRGDSGAQVRTLQNFLVTAGYGLTVDGKFGGQTEAAVLQFQRKAGLTADGVVGRQTRAQMRA